MSHSPTNRKATKESRYDMKRERDVRLHYGAAFCNIPRADDLVTHVPRLSRDSTLTALCQLTAIRMGGQRSMISILDSERQYILAEATRDLSLRPESPRGAQDALWVGNVSIPRSLGLCENVLDLSLENSVLVINDLATDERSISRGAVHSNSDARFYAGRALISPDGIIIGTLCIFDKEPRNGLTSEQLELFRDLSCTVIEYLNTYTIRDQYSRGERFTRGLISFAEGAPALLPFKQNAQPDSSAISYTSSETSSAMAEAPIFSHDRGRRESDDPSPDSSSPPTQRTAATRSARHRGIETLQDSILPMDSKSMFSRAANVMMASSNLDGVLILDASVAANGGQRRTKNTSRNRSGAESLSESYQSRSSSEGRSSNSTAEVDSRSTSYSSSKKCKNI
jgi:hypothetical protein